MSKPRPWTPAEDAALRRRYPDERSQSIAEQLARSLRSVYERAALLGLKKSPEYYATGQSGRLVDGKLGDATRFKPGQTPWNKGRPYQAGGRAAQTQFQPGEKPHTWRPIGTERLSKNGYLQRKLTDTGVTRHDYVPVHHIVWRAAGRDIPPGHALVFRDKNRQNFSLDNLELITRADLMRRNTVHHYGPEIAQLTQLRGAIVRKINNRLRKAA